MIHFGRKSQFGPDQFILFVTKSLWSSPNQFGRTKTILDQPKLFWSHRRTRHYTDAIALQVLALDPMPPSTLDVLHIVAIVLAWCPTFVNPIVYFYLDNKFYRRELNNWFRELGECQPRQKKHSLGMQNGKLWIDRRNIISISPNTEVSRVVF